MHLLYVCSDFGIRPDGTKGASIHLRAITRALADSGHSVSLLSPHPGPGGKHPASPLFSTDGDPADRVGRSLKRWLQSRGFDGAIASEIRPLLFNARVSDRAVEAARRARPAAVIERLSLFGHMGVDLSKALGVPLIVEVNAILTEEARAYRSLHLGALAREMEERTLRRADAVLTVSAALAERVAAMGVEPERIHVVPNGVDLQAFDGLPSREACRAELGMNGAFVVGFVGSLKVWHGVDDLLTAFTRLHRTDPAARLLIVGTGPMESSLEAQVREAGIEGAVTFTGAIEHERVPMMLRSMDVAVAPFKRVENFYFSPIKLFEYMASGTCTVASRLGQIAEVVEDGVSGLLAPPEDPDALHACLARLRKSSLLRERLAARADQAVRERFTWSQAARATLDVIASSIARRRPLAGEARLDSVVGRDPTEVSI